MLHSISPTLPHRQNGVVLIVGLVILLLMSILALTGATNAITTNRLVNHWAERDNALQLAEAKNQQTLADTDCINRALNRAKAQGGQQQGPEVSCTNGASISASSGNTLVPGYSIGSVNLAYRSIRINSDITTSDATGKLTHGYIGLTVN